MLLDKHELLISGKKIFGGVSWAGGVSMVGATKGRRVMDNQRGRERACGAVARFLLLFCPL